MGWFSGKSGGSNRREHERVKKAYKAAYTLDGSTWQPAIGVDLSDEGMCILSQAEIGEKQFNLRATLDTRVVNMRCAPIWHSRVNHNGKAVVCYGLKFVGISADDWDTVVKFISGEKPAAGEKPAEKPQEKLESVAMKQDDVARMLPQSFQERLFLELIKRDRLAAFTEGQSPLVEFEYAGVAPWRGKNMHRLTVHSRVVSGKSEKRYSTRFMFDENGREVIVLN
jgi:hypothetical protein